MNDLEKKLLGSQPPKKKIKKATVRHCPWKAGDLLAYHMITNPRRKNEPLFGKYVLLRVLRVDQKPLSKIVPTDLYDESMLIGLYGWCGDSCPDPEIVDQLEYIPFADYIPEPPPNLVDWNFLSVSDEEQRKKMQEGARNFFSHQIETSWYLNWIPNKGDSVDIQCIGYDSSFKEQIPDYFTDGLKKCILSNLYALEARLCLAMKPYYKGKDILPEE